MLKVTDMSFISQEWSECNSKSALNYFVHTSGASTDAVLISCIILSFALMASSSHESKPVANLLLGMDRTTGIELASFQSFGHNSLSLHAAPRWHPMERSSSVFSVHESSSVLPIHRSRREAFSRCIAARCCRLFIKSGPDFPLAWYFRERCVDRSRFHWEALSVSLAWTAVLLSVNSLIAWKPLIVGVLVILHLCQFSYTDYVEVELKSLNPFSSNGTCKFNDVPMEYGS